MSYEELVKSVYTDAIAFYDKFTSIYGSKFHNHTYCLCIILSTKDFSKLIKKHNCYCSNESYFDVIFADPVKILNDKWQSSKELAWQNAWKVIQESILLKLES